ncbi:MAG: hypothetical protein ACOYBV_02990 [Candidatus Avilachnospira sp.]|jgi:hypothetical protein
MNNTGKNEEREKTPPSYSKKQIYAARAALALILFLIIALIINVFAGGDPGITLALLFALIVFPCVFYGIRIYFDYTRKRDRN